MLGKRRWTRRRARLALGIGASRLAIGAGILFATRPALRRMGFGATDASGEAVAKLGGGRDIALGALTLAARDDREALRAAIAGRGRLRRSPTPSPSASPPAGPRPARPASAASSQAAPRPPPASGPGAASVPRATEPLLAAAPAWKSCDSITRSIRPYSTACCGLEEFVAFHVGVDLLRATGRCA